MTTIEIILAVIVYVLLGVLGDLMLMLHEAKRLNKKFPTLEKETIMSMWENTPWALHLAIISLPFVIWLIDKDKE